MDNAKFKVFLCFRSWVHVKTPMVLIAAKFDFTIDLKEFPDVKK